MHHHIQHVRPEDLFEPCFLSEHEERTLDRDDRFRLMTQMTKFILKNELSTRQNEILMLYYKEKKTMPEIAATLHISVSCVSHTHTRAIQKLRNKMRMLQ